MPQLLAPIVACRMQAISSQPTWNSACLCNAQQEPYCQEGAGVSDCRHAGCHQTPANSNAAQHQGPAQVDERHIAGDLHAKTQVKSLRIQTKPLHEVL